jgi:hypothetical protein
MIHYQLQCHQAHGFDGWFKDSTSFESQAKRGLLECPVCGSAKVERALMTPSTPRKGRARPPAAPPPAADNAPAEAAPGPLAVAGERLPDQVRAVLQRLRTEVESNCDYVGPDFADEARRIHRGQSKRRGIYGEASPDAAAALADDGIEIARIPWVPRSDS